MKRADLKRKLNFGKFFRILFGVLSIALVSLSAFSEFSDNCKFVFTLLALFTTTAATFSNELLDAFGFAERYRQNVGTLGALRNLNYDLELEIAVSNGEAGETEFDYWKYQKSLNSILNSGHKEWSQDLSRSKRK